MQSQPCPYERMILVCVNERPTEEPACGARGGKPIADALKKAAEAAGVADRVRVTKTRCLGPCEQGPNVMIYPENKWLSGVRAEDVPAIVQEFVRAGSK